MKFLFLFFSDPTSTIIHSVRFLQEDYYKDYQDVRKRRFKARKLEIEQKVSEVIHHLKQRYRREGWTDACSAVGFCLGSGLFGSYNSD